MLKNTYEQIRVADLETAVSKQHVTDHLSKQRLIFGFVNPKGWSSCNRIHKLQKSNLTNYILFRLSKSISKPPSQASSYAGLDVGQMFPSFDDLAPLSGMEMSSVIPNVWSKDQKKVMGERNKNSPHAGNGQTFNHDEIVNTLRLIID